jgi:GDPmannose 4,6-dehydratase
MYLILQQDQPDDYVISTGITTSIRDFIKMSGEEIGLEITFAGNDTDEKGFITSIDEKMFSENVGEQYLEEIKNRVNSDINSKTGIAPLVAIDPQYFRPTEVELLIGDSKKAREVLGWEPRYDLQGLIADMIQSDIKLMKKDDYLRNGGYRTLNYFE